MKWLVKCERIITNIFNYLLSILFLTIVILVFTLVVLRYGFNTTIVGGNELVVILFIYASAIGAAVIIGKKEHISITYFTESLPLALSKLVNIINLILVAILNGVMIVYSIPWISKTGGYLTAVLGIQRVYLQMVVPLSCSLAVLYCLYHIVVLLNPRKI